MGRTELLPFTPNVCVLRCRRVRLRRELCSALGAATGEDLAAVGGSHSLSEAMHLGSVTLSGLIGTNSCHGIYTSCKNMLNSGRHGASAAASQNLAAPMEHTTGIIADCPPFCQFFFAFFPAFAALRRILCARAFPGTRSRAFAPPAAAKKPGLDKKVTICYNLTIRTNERKPSVCKASSGGCWPPASVRRC